MGEGSNRSAGGRSAPTPSAQTAGRMGEVAGDCSADSAALQAPGGSVGPTSNTNQQPGIKTNVIGHWRCGLGARHLAAGVERRVVVWPPLGVAPTRRIPGVPPSAVPGPQGFRAGSA
ncbi:hypothetical protein GCM10010430_38100 [Kitasatospora cystarginea]|uniref:Uncharacterized protein n=1 Tax=Kitasatospora cystarginea TaxID=58350 RepID=A0ABN3E9I3_9ACTN